MNYFDFTRCQRADGSHYGTAGKCQKGRRVDPRDLKAKGITKEEIYKAADLLKSTGMNRNERIIAIKGIMEGKNYKQVLNDVEAYRDDVAKGAMGKGFWGKYPSLPKKWGWGFN